MTVEKRGKPPNRIFSSPFIVISTVVIETFIDQFFGARGRFEKHFELT